MIRWASSADRQIIAQIAAYDTITGIKILSLLDIYGRDMNVARFWLGGEYEHNPQYVMAMFSGTILIAAKGDFDIAEMCGFIKVLGCHSIESRHRCALEILAFFGGRFSTRDVMFFTRRESVLYRQAGGISIKTVYGALNSGSGSPAAKEIDSAAHAQPPTSVNTIDKNPRLEDVYRLLCLVEPSFERKVPFDSWYTDVSHRVRHGHAAVYTRIAEDGVCACTAGAYFISEKGVMLGSVATLDRYRGRRYATRLLHELCRDFATRELDIYIIPEDDYSAKLYMNLGFTYHDKQGWIIY